jgi:putative DNA primase/helicase
MTNHEAYFQCEYCGQQYDKEQFQSLQSDFAHLDDDQYFGHVICGNCQKKNTALRTGFDGPLNVAERIEPDPYELYMDDEPEDDEADYNNYITASEIQHDTEHIQPPSIKPQTFRLTDLGNAKRLVYLFGNNIHHSEGGWYIWKKNHWKRVSEGGMMPIAEQVADNIFKEAEAAPESERKELLKFAHKTESVARLKAMVKLAANQEGIFISQESFDANHWLLNTPGGTLNLKTGELENHSRRHLITKITPVNYTPRAKCPTWDAFLYRVMGGNQNLVDFLQRAIGYTLTGDTKEQCFFFLWGTGANGKSTFLETIRELMGDYGQQTDFSTFLKKQDAVRNDVARLQGARYVSGVEAGAGQQLQETLIKRLTGQDKITTRYLYQEFFEYQPTFKIFLGANHRPVIKGTDHAIWRRIHLIPFTVTIPPKEQDGDLRDKLRLELSGILNWALQGCLNWQKNKLQPPEEVSLATTDYRAEMDVLADFLEECCEEKPEAFVSKMDLYDVYEGWCQKHKEEALKKNAFGTKMKERGFEEKKSGNVRSWLGVQLKS